MTKKQLLTQTTRLAEDSETYNWKLDKRALRNSKQAFLTQALFLEHAFDYDIAVYSRSDEDKIHIASGKVYPSLKRLYIECNDPTEYKFATKYLGGWKHWQRLTSGSNKLLLSIVEEWRLELEVKLRSEGINSMHALTKEGNVNASKWIAEKGWAPKGRGRPSKEEVTRERKVQAAIKSEVQDDLSRLQ